MNGILDKLIDTLSSGNITIAIVIITVAIIFNHKKIIEFIEERKRAKISAITEALQSEHITGTTKSYLQEALVTEQFKLSTGVRLEKEFRLKRLSKLTKTLKAS